MKTRILLSWVCGLLLVLLSTIVLIYFGRLRSELSGQLRDIDAKFGYVAGVVWRQSADPYDYDLYKKVGETLGFPPLGCNFAYPPTSAWLWIPFSYLQYPAYLQVLAVINVMVALMCGALLAYAARESIASPLLLCAIVSLVVASPITSLNLFQGQSSLLALALALLALQAEQRKQSILQGILLALASFKISIVVLVIVWMATQGRWRALLSFLAAVVILAAPSLGQLGPITLTQEWLQALRQYKSYPFNQPAEPSSFGFSKLLVTYGLPPLEPLGLLLAALIFGMTWWRRRRFSPLQQMAICLALPVLFISAHTYDAVALLPLVVVTFLMARSRGWLWIPAAAAAVMMMLPPSLADRLHLDITLRILVLIVTLLCLIVSVMFGPDVADQPETFAAQSGGAVKTV